MTKEQRAVIKELNRIGRSGSKIETIGIGICGNIWNVIGLPIQNVFEGYYETRTRFKFYSGNLFYPIQHPEESNAQKAYNSTTDLWTGEYGRRRRMFARFLARELPKTIGE